MNRRPIPPLFWTFAAIALLALLVFWSQARRSAVVSNASSVPTAKPEAGPKVAVGAESRRVKFSRTEPRPKIASIDTRSAPKSSDLTPEKVQSLAAIRKDIPGVQVEFDPISGAPALVQATGRFLNQPTALAPGQKVDVRGIVEGFINRYPILFGHPGEALKKARVTREDVTAHNGMTTLVWNQEVNGIPVFKTIFKANVTKRGEIVSLSSHFLGTLNPNITQPVVPATDAISRAAASLNDAIPAVSIRASSDAQGAEKRQNFTAPGISDTYAHLTFLPTSATDVRMGWDVTTFSIAANEMFRMVIDAETGEVLTRDSLTADISDAHYRVFTSESPTPFSPGHEKPSSLQPAQANRVLLTTPAMNTTASPSGWINDGNMETNGNNVDAHTDLDANNIADLPRPNGGASRVFDFPLDLTQEPSAYRPASITQLFYWTNFMHDRMYEMGFTESAGNFQLDNFGRGGLGNDAIQADAQDGSGTDNANFSTPADGGAGRMQMYLWASPTPDRDGSFEAEVVLHEIGHGVSNRLVGGGVGISALSTRGMGEGWSDFLGLALTAEASDNPHGNWARGGYSRYLSSGWLSENYYYGARRYSYSTDMLKNPLTLKDIDPTQIDLHTSVQRNPTYGSTQDATQVHYQGTVWCAMLWEIRANLIIKHGFAIGNDRAIRLVTDGMKLAPVNPNFIQSRDGIIQATLVSFPGDLGEVWSAFAKRGAGQGATAPASSTTTGIVESYSVPDGLQINDRSGWNIAGNKGGPFAPTAKVLTLSNTSGTAINWSVATTAPWLVASPSSGALAAGASVGVVVTTQANIVAPGFHSASVVFTNTATSFGQPIGVRLHVTPPVVQSFDLSSDPGWVRTGEWAFGTPSGGGGAAGGGLGNADPAAGATGSNVFGVNLSGNHSTGISGPNYLTMGPVSMAGRLKTRLRFQRWLNTNALANTRTTVEVSTDGTTWREVFVNPGAVTADTAWRLMDYDISPIADNQPAIYVRWSYRTIASPGAYSGWNIDDVEFLGEPTNALVIASAAGATEGDVPVTATVTVTQPQAGPTTVALSSSDTTAATVPTSVTIPFGQMSAIFDITPVDDGNIDGPQSTVITASAAGVATGTHSFIVEDNESGTLTLVVPTTATEGDGIVQGTVTRDVVNASSITVSLLSSDQTAALVPATVVIPGGQASVNFNIEVVNDSQIDGNQPSTISASVSGWTSASAPISVVDNEPLALTVTLPVSVTEGGTGSGSVSISGTLTTPLVVSLSSYSLRLTVPSTVTIAAGSISAAFTLTAPNDAIVEVNGTARVTASAVGFTDGTRTMTVIDNDLHHFGFANITSPKTLNGPFTLTITAQNQSNNTVTGFIGTVGLSGVGASGAIAMSPTTTTAFVAGVWTGSVTISTPTTNIVLTANDGAGRTGMSNPFTVGVGAFHHFAFGNITSPKTAGTPFSTTITAQDIANNTVTSFASTATLSGATSPLTTNVGSGTSGTSVLPLYTYYHDQRTQCIYLQSEIGGAKAISGLALNITTVPGQTMNNWTIRMKHTALASYGTASWESTGWTTVYQANETISTTGLRAFTFATPFAYNGTSNLMVDFSFDNSTFTTAGGVTYTTSSTTRTIHYYTDSELGSPSTWAGSSPTPQTSTLLPNLVLTSGPSIAISPTVSGSFVSGMWTGNVTVSQPASQMVLRAIGGTSISNSNAFDVTGTVVANPQSVSVANSTPTAITLTGQDTANAGATLTYAIVTSPTNGALTGTAPNLTYTPTGGYVGADSFTFRVANGAILSAPATVTITVLQPPGEIVIEHPVGTGLTDAVSTVDYGVIPTGSATVRSFTVRNTGVTDLALSGLTKDGVNSSDVTLGALSATTLTAGATATFDVTFTPGLVGARAAAIHVLSNDVDEGSFDIALTATGSAGVPDIAVEFPAGTLRPDDAAIIDYGVTALNTPVVRTLTLRNTGGAALSITGFSVDGAAGNQFLVGTPSSTNIAAGGTATVDVAFSATTPGSKLAALHVLSNDLDEGSYDIELHGIGTIITGPVSLVKDVNSVAAGGAPANFLISGTNGYYQNNGSIYRTNGTAAGTTLVGATSSATSMAVVGTTLLYATSDVVAGLELWSYNGTTASRLVDINAGIAGSSPAGMVTVGSVVYFTATTSANGLELWKTDGTAAGTALVKDIVVGTGGSALGNLTNVSGTLFFTANDGTNGSELWKSDGTSLGTVLVANINATASAGSNPVGLTAVGSLVYFSATNGTSGVELWKSDGTAAGTVQVLDIVSGTGNSTPSSLFNWNGVVYFRATTTAAGAELWKSDGTAGGTVLVKDIFAGTSSSTPSNFASTGTSLFFSAMDTTSNGTELWKTDGTAVGTVMVLNINGSVSGSSVPGFLTAVGSSLFFAATDGLTGVELWKSDGTALGTSRVEDINLGAGGAGIAGMANLGGTLLFGANDLATGGEIWRSDGTVPGTYRVSDTIPGNFSPGITGMVAMGSNVFFSANDGVVGSEPWKSDGTSAGSAVLRDIAVGTNPSTPANFTTVGNTTLYFNAVDSTNGSELWKSDGTTGNTVLVTNLNAGSASSSPGQLRAIGSTLYFVATDTTANGAELWKTDGSAAGTLMVKNINPTTNVSGAISSLTVIGSELYFSANDGTNGAELWKSDGTDAGTFMVKNLSAGIASSSPSGFVGLGTTVFFVANDGVNGAELWKTDGTDAGTVLVRDIFPGSSSSSVSGLTAYNGLLYFSANDGSSNNSV
jgi:ELWxxDGT repeat protein